MSRLIIVIIVLFNWIVDGKAIKILGNFSLILNEATWNECIFLDQNVQCDPKQIHVFFHFDKPFDGVIYAKGFHSKEKCKIFGQKKNKLSISLLLNVNSEEEPYCGVKLNKVWQYSNMSRQSPALIYNCWADLAT